jgi:hypothetical protein
MSSDWIKMRTDIYRDPKISTMADVLIARGGGCNSNVTRNVMRNACVGALVSVWGVVRQRGKRIGSDLRVTCANISALDDISDIEGFGAALESIGWVVQSDNDLVFPRFFDDYNAETGASKNAERQRKYRETRKALRNVTVTDESNTEKKREEKSILSHLEKPPEIPPEAEYFPSIEVAPGTGILVDEIQLEQLITANGADVVRRAAELSKGWVEAGRATSISEHKKRFDRAKTAGASILAFKMSQARQELANEARTLSKTQQKPRTSAAEDREKNNLDVVFAFIDKEEGHVEVK